MKKKTISILLISALAVIGYTTQAQMYRTAATEALENNGKEWVEKKLPPSVITFSDYSGQVEIKTLVTTLTAQQEDSATNLQPAINYADFTMNLDKDQLSEQLAIAKNFTTTGLLTINNVSKKIDAQYTLESRNNPGAGYTISVIIRFNPADFNLKPKDESNNEPLIVRVSNGYLNKQSNNF